jgi:catechol 2,3-dioxygenase-like lactoylglutathione lyase family enzyme
MTIGIIEINHVNVVVPKHLEDEAKHFYASVLGLKEIPKPAESQARGGAWYELGRVQLHLSARVEDGNGQGSKGHVCFTVADVVNAENALRSAEVEIIPDDRPIAGKPRFYVRDPGENLIEIAGV